jgi:hypothetical protein
MPDSVTQLTQPGIDTQSQLISDELLRNAGNPALDRLSRSVAERNTAPAVNYSRMHHRHARTHTRAK